MQEGELIVERRSGGRDDGFVFKQACIPVEYPGSDVAVNV